MKLSAMNLRLMELVLLTLNKHTVTPPPYIQTVRNLIVGPMPMVEGQQQIFQAGKIYHLLVM